MDSVIITADVIHVSPCCGKIGEYSGHKGNGCVLAADFYFLDGSQPVSGALMQIECPVCHEAISGPRQMRRIFRLDPLTPINFCE